MTIDRDLKYWWVISFVGIVPFFNRLVDRNECQILYCLYLKIVIIKYKNISLKSIVVCYLFTFKYIDFDMILYFMI